MAKSKALTVQDSLPQLAEENCTKKHLMVLLALYQELLNNTFSPDVRYLSVAAAVERLSPFMDEKEATEIAKKFMKVRQRNIIDGLFE